MCFHLTEQQKHHTPASTVTSTSLHKRSEGTYTLFPVSMCVCSADINELNLPKTCEINFPDDDDLLNFRLIIYPDEVCSCCCVVV